jgi:glycosyltransferase involved in cell wall biosynthesis
MEVVTRALLQRLDPNRFVPELICLGANNGILSRIDHSRVDCHVIQKRRGIDVTLAWRLAAHFRRKRPDVLLTCNSGALLYGYPAARLSRLEALVHAEHGRLLVDEHPAQRFVRVQMTRRADHVVVVSSALKQLLVETEHVDARRVSVIGNGVDLERYDTAQRAEDGGETGHATARDPGAGHGETAPDRDSVRAALGLSAHDWVVGSVGSLTAQKNHALLLEAVAKSPEITLLIAGAGPLESTLRAQLDRWALSDRVQLLGPLEDVPRFLAALDLFVLPSLTEGTSIALLEAMAARLPVIATDVGGNRPVLDDGRAGVLVPSNDANALAEKLNWSVRHRRECKQLGEKGRARVESLYHLGGMVEAYERLFERLVLD